MYSFSLPQKREWGRGSSQHTPHHCHSNGVACGGLKPHSVTSSPSWQSRAAQGFDHTGFTIDWQAKKATCPQGKSSRKWTLKQDRTVSGVIRIQFGKQDCLARPCRSQCTTAITNPCQLVVRPQAQFEAIQAARQRQQTQAFKERYAIRAGIEGTISEARSRLRFAKKSVHWACKDTAGEPRLASIQESRHLIG